MGNYLDKVNLVLNEVNKVVIGKSEVIRQVMTSIIAGGHILLEDTPGVGKTTIAVAFSKAMELDVRRVQFTPDVMPTDVIGFNILNKDGNMEYKEGPVLCNLFLADEINRTSPKTQSALLEVMEEGKITIDGMVKEVPQPFIVMATQNPTGSAGTQLLPESQLDRFMVKLSVGYPDVESEVVMLRGKMSAQGVESVQQVITREDLINIKNEVLNIFVNDAVLKYIADIAAATRNNYYLKLGLSPRGTIALAAMSKATAYLSGREYVIPEDVRYVADSVMGHRVILNTKARVNNVTTDMVIDDILKNIAAPNIYR
ncbi:MAG: MoxR family ATPase [Lachnospiraceae bacterium]|nr:MoxR family ATPase [Lachnospiraceae bacterium]